MFTTVVIKGVEYEVPEVVGDHLWELADRIRYLEYYCDKRDLKVADYQRKRNALG